MALYEKHLREAGFAHVQVVDSGADLNAYAKVENQAACCSPAMEAAEKGASSCCGGSAKAAKKPKAACCCSSEAPAADLHERMKDLLTRYNVNDYAASVKVFAVKP